MVRVIHSFSIKAGVVESSFIEWLDSALNETCCQRFGCLQRKTWVFLDGFEGTYEKNKTLKRPKYLNEAFWPSQKEADAFRQWLMSNEGKDLRERWFNSITDHTLLRYMEFAPPFVMGEE